ncbi:unnamed protein product [Bubo scandiacus]
MPQKAVSLKNLLLPPLAPHTPWGSLGMGRCCPALSQLDRGTGRGAPPPLLTYPPTPKRGGPTSSALPSALRRGHPPSLGTPICTHTHVHTHTGTHMYVHTHAQQPAAHTHTQAPPHKARARSCHTLMCTRSISVPRMD